MMKVVIKVTEISDAKTKKKVLRAISGVLGIVSMAMNTEDNKITVIGTADPIEIIGKVRKICASAYIISVEPKKEEPKPAMEQIDWVKAYTAFPSNPTTHYYYPLQEEYNPNACVIS